MFPLILWGKKITGNWAISLQVLTRIRYKIMLKVSKFVLKCSEKKKKCATEKKSTLHPNFAFLKAFFHELIEVKLQVIGI
jgi:hypothetical protein